MGFFARIGSKGVVTGEKIEVFLGGVVNKHVVTPQTPFLEQRTQTEGRAVNDRKAFGRIQGNEEISIVLVEEISDQRNFFVEKSGFRDRR